MRGRGRRPIINPVKLRTRFSLSLIVYTALVLGSFGAAYYAFERRAAVAAGRAEQVKAVEKAASVCREMNLAASAIIALNYINVLKKEPGITAAGCFDARGLVQAHSEPDKIGTWWEGVAALERLSGSGPISLPAEGGRVEWYLPVAIGGARAGWAFIGYDQGFLDRLIDQRLAGTMRQLLKVAGGTLILAIVFSLLLASGLTRPIGKLVDAARAIGGGNLDYATPSMGRGDELDHLSEEINSMARQLKHLDELKKEFINIVSHDLRSPLGAIIGYADYLLSEEIGPLVQRQKDSIEVIRTQCRHLTNMVNNILDMAKIQSGKMEFIREPFSVHHIGEEIHTLFQFAAKQREQKFELDVPKELAAVGDSDKIHQVITNLVSNAMKFTKAGGRITIGAREEAGGRMVRIFVQDTGYGIPEDQLPHMFERFHQIDAQQQRMKKIRGTGLGLAISKGIVEALGGKIWVESKVGAGSTFHFTLPRAQGGLSNGASSPDHR